MQPSIQAILRKRSIVEYLELKGHKPARSMPGGKLAYFCPLPDHEDRRTPSFIVWTNADYENFHCFGCQRDYSIIHLVSYIEGISVKESVKRLSEGLEISFEEDMQLVLDAHLRKIDRREDAFAPQHEVSEALMSMSSLCRSYMQSVEFDNVECGIIDRFWSVIDGNLLSFDFAAIRETVCHLPLILHLRREKFERLRLQRKREEYASRIDN